MCRHIKFEGACTRCTEKQIWEDLSQKLYCLDAKNDGTFGHCYRGIFVESHSFDQECQRCIYQDEGIGDLGVYDVRPVADKRKPAEETAPATAKKQRT